MLGIESIDHVLVVFSLWEGNVGEILWLVSNNGN